MKRLILILSILLAGMVFLSSCHRGPSYLLTDDTAEIKNLTPACIIWYKPGKTGGEVNKSWCQQDEMNKIRELLLNADKVIVYTVGEYKLSLMFYDGSPENLKLWEVRFTLLGKKGFWGSVGSSQELGELLSQYAPEREVLRMPFGDPNRIKAAQESLMRQNVEARRSLGLTY